MEETTYKIHPSDEPGFVSALDAMEERAEKAVYQSQLDIAKGMKETNLSMEEIARISKLPLEVVKKL